MLLKRSPGPQGPAALPQVQEGYREGGTDGSMVLLRHNCRATLTLCLKCTRNDLHASWNDCHRKFSERPSPHTDAQVKKWKQSFPWWWELLGFTLNNFYTAYSYVHYISVAFFFSTSLSLSDIFNLLFLFIFLSCKIFFLLLFPQYKFFFSAVQHSDPGTYTCTHSFFSHYHALS